MPSFCKYLQRVNKDVLINRDSSLRIFCIEPSISLIFQGLKSRYGIEKKYLHFIVFYFLDYGLITIFHLSCFSL